MQETQFIEEEPKPLSPSAYFNTAVSSEVIQHSLKECVPAGITKSVN